MQLRNKKVVHFSDYIKKDKKQNSLGKKEEEKQKKTLNLLEKN